ncbi:hypothetical protein CP061683_1462B, partial [Chlamydia psittaci 06-1683]
NGNAYTQTYGRRAVPLLKQIFRCKIIPKRRRKIPPIIAALHFR